MKPTKDAQKITRNRDIIRDDIEGLIIKNCPPVVDSRGELTEAYNPIWGISDTPLVYAYYTSLRPGVIKGWVMHKLQDDRIFVMSGVQHWAFFDARSDSSTYKNLVTITITERNRALIIIPKMVFHAVKNVGSADTMFVNHPTKPYDREKPDKYRLSVKNDLIPYDFSDTLPNNLYSSGR